MLLKIISIIKKKYLIIFITLIAFFLTVYFTYPFIKYLPINYGTGDFELNAWMLWYNTKILPQKVFNIREYFNSPNLYPFSQTLAHQDTMIIPSMLLYAPTFLFTKNHILAVNTFIFLSYILNFLSAYYSVEHLIKNKFSSLIAAIIFTFSPISQIKLYGHLEYLNRFFIPPFFVILLSLLKTPTFKNALLLGFFYTLNWFTNIQITIFITIISVFIFIVYLAKKLAQNKNIKSWFVKIIKNSLLCITIYLPFILYFFYPYLEYSIKEGLKRYLYEITIYSAQWYDFLLGLPANRIFGKFYELIEPFRISHDPPQFFNYSEHTLFPGFLVMSLLLSAAFKKYFFFTKTINIKSKGTEKYIFFLSFLFSIILSFGPFLNIGKKTFFLPYYYIYKIFPILAASRVPTRISLIWIFFVSFLVASEVKILYKRLDNNIIKKNIFAICIFLILLIEYNHNIWINTTKIENIKYDLTAKNVLFIPFPQEPWDNSKYQTYMVSSNNIYNVFNANTGSEASIYDYVKTIEEIGTFSFDKNWFDILLTLNFDYLIIDKKNLRTQDNNNYTKIMNGVIEFKELIVFDDHFWQILDLKKINNKNCPFSRFEDLELNLNAVKYSDDEYLIVYSGNNNSQCNMQFLGERRYLPIRYKVFFQKTINNFFKKERQKAYLKIPPYLLSNTSFVRELPIPKNKISGAEKIVIYVLDKEFVFSLNDFKYIEN